jgi:hypothetical protein
MAMRDYLRRSALVTTETELKLIATVVDEREAEVLLHVGDRRLGELAGAHDAAQISLHEDHFPARHRHVGAGPHGDADVGLGQRGRVVDAVARHRHATAFGLQPGDQGELVGGRDLAADFIQPQLRPDRFRRREPVARGHDDADALVAQRADCLGRGVLDGIGDRDQARKPAIDREEHHRRALGSQRFGRLHEGRGVDAGFHHAHGVAEHDGLAVDLAAHAEPRRRLELRGL